MTLANVHDIYSVGFNSQSSIITNDTNIIYRHLYILTGRSFHTQVMPIWGLILRVYLTII